MRENEKPTLITRRQILASGIAMAGTIPFLPIARAAAVREPRTAKLRLTAGTRTLAVNGKPARVFGLIGPNETPGITVAPGERFNVDLVNQAATSPSFTGTASCHPGGRTAFPGRKRLRSRPATPAPMIMRRSLARTGCTRITTCRNRA
jgi:hypothetical protein